MIPPLFILTQSFGIFLFRFYYYFYYYLTSFCGILLGPPLADIVPNPGALVLIGEIG